MAAGERRVGVVLPQSEMRPSDPALIRRFAEAVEAAGASHLLVFDHVLGADTESRPDWDGPYDHSVPFLEPFTLFSYLAGRTALELVTDVLVLPQRQTALVAKQAATVDILTEGRLRLGVGIGWNEVEFGGLGMDFRSRARRMEEQIRLLRLLWTRDSVSFEGQFDTVDRAGIAPLPVQRPIPIWIGCGDATPALERVGRLADGWLPRPLLGRGERLEAAWRVVREAASAAGRDPDSIGLELQIPAVPDRIDRAQAAVDRWHALGATHFSLLSMGQGYSWPSEHLTACLALLGVLNAQRAS